MKHYKIYSRLKVSIITILCFVGLSEISGQKYVHVQTSTSVDEMMKRFVENGKSNETIKAWRIQIITTNDRREMELAKANFSSMYPDINIDWKHVSPYYQVRVGFYENKNKLMPFLLDLKKTFPSATPVYDNINKRALVSN
jgi:hypothetical protein